MIFEKTEIPGVLLIPLEKRSDDRGFLARIYGADEFAKEGIDFHPVQAYYNHSLKKGTMRGLHVQLAPAQSGRLSRCIRGELYHVVVDLRPESPTYMKWQGFQFKASDSKMLFVPKGVAQGALSLVDETEFESWYDHPFTAESETGIRYDDPAFNIQWPIPVEIVSEKDLSWPKFEKK